MFGGWIKRARWALIRKGPVYIFYGLVHICSIKLPLRRISNLILFGTKKCYHFLAELVTYVLVLILDHIQWMGVMSWWPRYFEAHISECKCATSFELRCAICACACIFVTYLFKKLHSSWEFMSDNYDTQATSIRGACADRASQYESRCYIMCFIQVAMLLITMLTSAR